MTPADAALDAVSQLSVNDLNDFRQLLKHHLGMTLLVGEPPTLEYTIVVTGVTQGMMIPAIKALRDIKPWLCLKEAKDIIDTLPYTHSEAWLSGTRRNYTVATCAQLSATQPLKQRLQAGGLEVEIRARSVPSSPLAPPSFPLRTSDRPRLPALTNDTES